MADTWQIKRMESDGFWLAEWDPTINPKQPTGFAVEKTPEGLFLVCDGPPYSGELAKCVNPLLFESATIEFDYEVRFEDDLTSFGQVIETDNKITDATGFTYDGSLQFNVAEDWMVQVGNPWIDTGVKVHLPTDMWNQIAIKYALDYAAKTIRVVSVNGIAISTPPIPAQNLGWAPNEIVTQLQLCIGGVGGAYSVTFGQMELQGL